MSQVREVLVKARGLIEKGWTQNTLARDSNGSIVPVASDDAVCFCVMGAVERAFYNLSGKKTVQLHVRDAVLDRLEYEVNYEWIGNWNDAPERKKEEVLAMFDKAIEAFA